MARMLIGACNPFLFFLLVPPIPVFRRSRPSTRRRSTSGCRLCLTCCCVRDCDFLAWFRFHHSGYPEPLLHVLFFPLPLLTRHIHRRLALSSAPTTAGFSPTPVDKLCFPLQLKFTSLCAFLFTCSTDFRDCFFNLRADLTILRPFFHLQAR